MEKLHEVISCFRIISYSVLLIEYLMRIALISWEALYGTPVGSASVYVHRLAAALTFARHDARLFTRMSKDQRISDIVNGVSYTRFPVERRASFLQEMKDMAVSCSRYVEEEIERAGPFDVIHAVDWLMIPSAFAILDRIKQKNLQTPRLAITFHATEWGRSGQWPSSGESKAIADIEREGIARADCVIAVSRHVMRELDSLYHPPEWKSKVIRHGIDLTPFDNPNFHDIALRNQWHWPPGHPVLLCTGRLIPKNRPELVLRAFVRVIKNSPGIPALLAFAGDGPEKNTLAGEARRLGVAERVYFLPRLTGQELADVYRLCVLALSPVDVFGAGALSAWAARIPVIAGAGSGSAEAVWDDVNGWILPLDDQRWADMISYALKDPDRLAWMGRNGRAALETAFTWESAMTQTIDIYQRQDKWKVY